MKHTPGAASCSAEVALQGPLDIPTSVEGFRRWGDDLLDRWDGEVLLRTIRVAGEAVPLACRPTGTVARPKLHVTVDDPHHLDAATKAASGFFVTVPKATLTQLTDRDPVIRAAEHLHPGVRPVVQPDLLTALVRSISAQQINLRFAAVVRTRLAQRYGKRHEVDGREVYSLEPEPLSRASAADLRALQFTTRKSEYIIGVASAVLGGALDVHDLAQRSDDQVIAELVTLQGIGRWTAEWILARTLGRATVVAGDLGVRKAIGNAYVHKGAMPSEQEVRELTSHWGDAGGVAQQLLLQVLAEDGWDALSAAAAAPSARRASARRS